MKKKVGKTRGNRRRQAVKDLAPKSRDAKGGKISHSDLVIVKAVDAASPKLF